MSWRTAFSTSFLKTSAQLENIDTAIRLFENSRTRTEELKSLDIMEKTFETLFIFTARDCNESLRENRKNQRDALLNRFRELVQQRKKGRISKYQLAGELRALCKVNDRGGPNV